MGRHLTKTIKIQLSDEARDVPRFENEFLPVKVLLLKFLVIEQNRGTVGVPSDRTAFASVHDPPKFLGKSHRKDHTIVVHALAAEKLECFTLDRRHNSENDSTLSRMRLPLEQNTIVSRQQ
ncbi:hypothetical protein KPH14_003564 [Odynerus spinipes]|uniref:Uncharacterized protein n=1 Tax=Odynerus spinipes TaxID=1348599 RepID=A0AAD9RD40_9HYME|nr:hypothetical protein KPH14_003564 [Odynerus spinipes]